MIDKLRALDGQVTHLGGSAATPVITVDLADPASAYWAVQSLLYDYVVEGDLPEPTWVDDTQPNAVN